MDKEAKLTLQDVEEKDDQSEVEVENLSQNSEGYDGTVFAKNVKLAVLVKDMETNNKCLRSHVKELYSTLYEKSQSTQNAKDEQSTKMVLKGFEKSESEMKSALTALNLHFNEMVDRVNGMEVRRAAIEKSLPCFKANYEQTLQEAVEKLKVFSKKAKDEKENSVVKQEMQRISGLIEKCHDEIQKVQGSISLRQEEMSMEKTNFFDMMEKVENVKLKEELLLKMQEEHAFKISNMVENQKELIRILQENKELQENQKIIQEREKVLCSETAELQDKLKAIELEKEKLALKLKEALEDNKNVVNTLTHERDYEAVQAKKYEQFTVDTNQRLGDEIKQKEELAKKNKLLEERISELQNNMKIVKEKASIEKVSQRKTWNITDSDSVHTSTSFNSITFSYVEDKPDPVQRKRKFRLFGKPEDGGPQQTQFKKNVTSCEKWRSIIEYTNNNAVENTKGGRSKEKWPGSQ